MRQAGEVKRRRQAPRLAGWLLLLAPLGCASPIDERVRDYQEDGVHLFSRGDYQGARESFEAAVALTPNDAKLLYNLGQCHDRTGDWRQAEHYYLACLRASPQHSPAKFAQVTLLYKTGRQPEANRMIEEWLTSKEGLADAYALDAWRLRQDKAVPQAQARLQQALALDPHHPRALVELGIIYEMTGMPDRALALYERSLERDPHQSEVADRVRQMRAKGVKRPLPD
jgi:Tfp pilus assembly protein PilF